MISKRFIFGSDLNLSKPVSILYSSVVFGLPFFFLSMANFRELSAYSIRNHQTALVSVLSSVTILFTRSWDIHVLTFFAPGGQAIAFITSYRLATQVTVTSQSAYNRIIHYKH